MRNVIYSDIAVKDGNIILTLSTEQGLIDFTFDNDKLMELNTKMVRVIDPNHDSKKMLQSLKKQRRDLYQKMRKESDPETRKMRYSLYEEMTKLVKDLEQSLNGG